MRSHLDKKLAAICGLLMTIGLIGTPALSNFASGTTESNGHTEVTKNANTHYIPGQTIVASTPAGLTRFSLTSTGDLDVFYNGTVVMTVARTGGGGWFTVQTDGNFVLYSAADSPVWASNSRVPSATGGYIAGQADGNIVLYRNNTNGTVSSVWASNTSQTAPGTGTVDYGCTADKTPTQSLASSVLSSGVLSSLDGPTTYNGQGSFTVNGNTPDITGVPAGTNAFLDQQPLISSQLGNSIALVNLSTYEGTPRTGSATYMPPGWVQVDLPSGSSQQYLFNRGHSLGYAIIGNYPGFDASENNPNNISTQTAWANQANGGVQGEGQNYWEGIVRNSISAGGAVQYEVEPVYASASDLVPAGTHIEAKSVTGTTISFNVFVPNIEPGVKINYTNGSSSIVCGGTATSPAPTATPTYTPSSTPSASQTPPLGSAYACGNRNGSVTVYVNKSSSVYWCSQTNAINAQTGDKYTPTAMTEATALGAGKHHSLNE